MIDEEGDEEHEWVRIKLKKAQSKCCWAERET